MPLMTAASKMSVDIVVARRAQCVALAVGLERHGDEVAAHDVGIDAMHGPDGFVRIFAGRGVMIDDADDTTGSQRRSQRLEQCSAVERDPSSYVIAWRNDTRPRGPSTSARRRRCRATGGGHCAARRLARRSAADCRRNAFRRSAAASAVRAPGWLCAITWPRGPTRSARESSVYQPVAAFMLEHGHAGPYAEKREHPGWLARRVAGPILGGRPDASRSPRRRWDQSTPSSRWSASCRQAA